MVVCVKPEVRTARITRRLAAEGWIVEHGGSHDIWRHADFKAVRIVVPRHKELSRGVARQIARLAGW
jgi:predicted RNA binding protein YcfA (HicA-like mRNA interferase family)